MHSCRADVVHDADNVCGKCLASVLKSSMFVHHEISDGFRIIYHHRPMHDARCNERGVEVRFDTSLSGYLARDIAEQRGEGS